LILEPASGRVELIRPVPHHIGVLQMSTDIAEGYTETTLSQVDINHPWVAQYRVPVVRDMHVGTFFIAALVVPDNSSEYSNYMNYLAPDEEDAKLIAQYIRYRKTQLTGWYLKQVEARSLDIDSGVNTITFAKREHGWVYRRMTWQNQPFAPSFDGKIQYATLAELLDHVNTYVDEVSPKWIAFKEKEAALEGAE